MKENKKNSLKLTLTFLLAAGLTLFCFLAIVGIFYSTKPSFCNLCHIMKKDYQAWRNSPHHKASCLACHQESGLLGSFSFRLQYAQMILSYLTGHYQKPIKADVSNQNCLSCHTDIVETVKIHRTIRMSHKEPLEKGIKCTDCHNTVTHQNAVAKKNYPHMEKCTDCHNGEQASNKCDTCHAEQESRKPRYRMGPWAITHSDKWRKTHGMGNLSTCSVCHPKDYCVRCHQTQLPHSKEIWPATHGRNALKSIDACYSCHFKNYCASCHQIEMPHPIGWLPNHPKQAKNLGEKNCLRCHVEYDCDDCHQRHIHRAVVHQKNRN